MHTITYVSTAASHLSKEDINALLVKSKKFNDLQNIKGIFMFAEGNFFQILEGDEREVKTLFEKIEKDKRHYDLIKLFDKKVEDASFEHYSSSFSIIDNQKDILELHKYLKRAKEYNPEVFRSISYITKKFIALI